MKNPLLKSEPFRAFIVSRLVIFIVILFAAQNQTTQISAKEGVILNPAVELSIQASISGLKRVLSSADAGWYLEIAKNGYHSATGAGPKNWVFFPLYPLCVKFFASITGKYLFSAIIISNLCFLLSLFLLHRIATKLDLDEKTATRAVWFLALFPTSYFFSAPFTESLFLALLLGSFLALLSNRYLLASLIFAALTASRPTGLMLYPAFAVFLFQQNKTANFRKLILVCLIAPAGAIVYMAFLWSHTGDMFAFATNQLAWNRNEESLRLVFSQVFSTTPLVVGAWNFHLLNFLAALAALIGSAIYFKNKNYAFALILMMPVLAALTTGLSLSMCRHVSVLFPIYLLLAQKVSGESLERNLIVILSSLLAIMTLLYSLHVTAAMT